MKKFLIGGIATAMFVSGGVAYANAPAPAKGAAPTQRVAKNETRAEVQARVQAMFARLDPNHDNVLTKDEVAASTAQREAKAEQRAARFDPAKVFDRIDANHDGKIT